MRLKPLLAGAIGVVAVVGGAFAGRRMRRARRNAAWGDKFLGQIRELCSTYGQRLIQIDGADMPADEARAHITHPLLMTTLDWGGIVVTVSAVWPVDSWSRPERLALYIVGPVEAVKLARDKLRATPDLGAMFEEVNLTARNGRLDFTVRAAEPHTAARVAERLGRTPQVQS